MTPIHLLENKKYLGLLNMKPNPISGVMRIPVLSELPFFIEDDGAHFGDIPDVKDLVIPMKRMNISISMMNFRVSRTDLIAEVVRQHNIPPNFTTEKDPMHDAMILSWHVGVVDLDLYEQVFDLDIFEPA